MNRLKATLTTYIKESRVKGKDDKKYLALMNAYKTNRMEKGIEANRYLEAAMKLRKVGEVSDDAIIGAAYL